MLLTVSGRVKAYLRNGVYMFKKQRVKKPVFHSANGLSGRWLCRKVAQDVSLPPPSVRAQLTSAFSQDLLACRSLPWAPLTSLAVSASLGGITFPGLPLKVTVLTLHCSSYYNSGSNEHPRFTPSSVMPLFSTGWKPHNLQDDQHFILKC